MTEPTPCTKTPFTTLKAARTALNACKRKRAMGAGVGRHRHERSFYVCPHCKRYHLTSEKPNGRTRFV